MQALYRFRMLNCWPDDNVTTIRTRDRPADQNYLFFLADLHDLEILHCHAFVTHVSGHPHIFPNPTWGGTIADGAVPAVRFRTMGRALTGEIVLLHHALE